MGADYGWLLAAASVVKNLLSSQMWTTSGTRECDTQVKKAGDYEQHISKEAGLASRLHVN